MAAPTAPNAATYWDKHGFPTVSIGELQKILRLTLESNMRRAVVLAVSEAGEGKTQVVHAEARRANCELVDLRTAAMNMMSLGVPQRPENGFFRIALPSNMPRKGDGKRYVIHLDEFNMGEKHVTNMLFSLLEDHRIYDYELPEDTVIVISMNPANGGYAVSKIEANPALNRRTAKYYVISKYEDWRRHAVTPGFHFTDGMEYPCHRAVLEYLHHANSALKSEGARDRGEQFACPATWQTVSLICYNHDKANEPLDSEFTLKRLCGIIGNLQATPFINFLRDSNILISPSEILNNYTAKSPIRARTLKVLQNPAGVSSTMGDLNQLLHDIMHHLVDSTPDPEVVAPNLVRFFADICEHRPERAEKFFAELFDAYDAIGGNTQTDKGAVKKYISKLSLAMAEIPAWGDLQDRYTQTARGFEQKLKKTQTALDPMR